MAADNDNLSWLDQYIFLLRYPHQVFLVLRVPLATQLWPLIIIFFWPQYLEGSHLSVRRDTIKSKPLIVQCSMYMILAAVSIEIVLVCVHGIIMDSSYVHTTILQSLSIISVCVTIFEISSSSLSKPDRGLR